MFPSTPKITFARTVPVMCLHREVAMMILSILLSSALAADVECDPVVSAIYPDLGEFAWVVEGALLPRPDLPSSPVTPVRPSAPTLWRLSP